MPARLGKSAQICMLRTEVKMPIAIVIDQSKVVPEVLTAKDTETLVSELQGLTNTPATVVNEQTVRLWLKSLPPPSGWFESASEVRDFLARSRQ